MVKKVGLRFGVLAGVLAWLLLASQPAEATNIVINGGFETGSFTPYWTLGGDQGFTSVVASPVHSGAYAAEFGSIGSDTIMYQILPTTPGAAYAIRFWLMNDAGGTPNNDFSAYFGGTTLMSLTNAPTMVFGEFSFDGLLAAGPNTTLQFSSRNVPSFWHLDDVSVEASAIPEPASLLLLSTGLVGAIAARRRRR